MITYAQAKEDILLWRCLAGRVSHEVGFYIDVGANHHEVDSVTKVFYEHGWRGINIDASPDWYVALCKNRSRDINIHAVATDRPGRVQFHDIIGHQLGTVVEKFADRHVAGGLTKRTYSIDGITLTTLCEQYAPREIHFLKIDVEGHEGAVLRGMDFVRFRPWLLVIEATEPNRQDVPTYAEWDSLVIEAGYRFVYTDILNRYYVANEHPELLECFVLPPDDYVRASDLRRISELEVDLAAARQMLAEIEQREAPLQQLVSRQLDFERQIGSISREMAALAEFRNAAERALSFGWSELQALQRRTRGGALSRLFRARG